MDDYIKRTYEAVKEFTEEEVMEIMTTNRKNSPIEFIPVHFCERTTLGDIVRQVHPKLIKKYKLLIEDDEKKRKDEDY